MGPFRTAALSIVAISTAGALMLETAPEARAQTACRTPNCALSTSPPAGCQNRAVPSTMQVEMTGFLTFDPANPKIEPGDCIEWTATGFTHNSSANDCADTDLTCDSVDPTCMWETGNTASASSPPSNICFYDPITFPAGIGDSFYCRIHASPTIGTMRGTLLVTTEIKVQMAKSGNNVVLSWTGGGVTGDVTYKVVRSDTADPTFAANLVFDPDLGVTGTSFTDAGELLINSTHFYLVRNKQANE